MQALKEAAAAAVETGRYETAVRHASRALDLHPVDATLERWLLLIRSNAEIERRNFAQGLADAEEVLAGALAAGDAIQEGEARRRLGSVAQMQGDLPTARRELGAAVDLFRAAGDEKRLAGALRARGFAEVFGGSLDDARWLLGEAMDLYHRIDDERGPRVDAPEPGLGVVQRRRRSTRPRASWRRPSSASRSSATPTACCGPTACWRGCSTSSAASTRPRRWRRRSRATPGGAPTAGPG